MADVPVTFITAAGPHEVLRPAVEWLWETLDSNALPATSKALDAGLNGENVTVPDAEMASFCEHLDGLIGRAEPSERTAALTELRRLL